VAFINPDQSRAVILCNDATYGVDVSVQEGNRLFWYHMPAQSVVSFKWDNPYTASGPTSHESHSHSH
jgi:O-glycosyl hydrolase